MDNEKAVHSPPVFEADEPVSCTKKLRFEGSPVYEDNGYTLFIDSGYKLPLYLSEFALGEFNHDKKAAFEKVNVVQTMKSVDIVKGTTYLITFEASLPDNKSDYAQTFETNIFMSPLDPTAKIEIKFVRIKPSDLDYNGKEDYGDKVSESDEENFEEKPSEFGEEDTEKKLSESDKNGNEEKLCESDDKDSAEAKRSESDGKDSAEEKLVESDEKKNKENLFESVEKDTEEKLSKFDGKDSAEEKIAEFNEKNSEEEKLAESNMKPSEELWDSDDEFKEGSESSKEFQQYRLDVEKSDGFEVGYYPNLRGSCCMLRSYYDPPARTLSTTYLDELVRFSQLAICLYNMNNVTCYHNVRVIKATVSGCGGTTYRITFQASLSNGNAVTFQTLLYASLPFPYHEIEVDFVRIKPVINPDIIN